jgi:Putative metal-binding motif/Lectin C-type domain
MIALLALVAPSFAFNWYLDSDGDGYGDSAYLIESDTAPSGYVDNDDDCDDDSALAHPDGTETCDGLDNDCSGDVDEGEVCPCEVEQFNGHAYMFCETAATVSEARDFCSTYTYDLATISTAEEDAWVDDEVDARSTDVWWVGGNDIDAEGAWTWGDGSDQRRRQR